MPQIIDLGKIRFSFKGSYSASTTYVQNDVVTFGANAYVYTSTTAASGNAPTDTTRWAVLTSGLQFENAWNSGTSYQANDVVTYGGNAYVAIQGGTNYVPTDVAYWSPLTSGVRDRGNWVTATQYFPNDLVTRGGSKYSASVVHTSASAFIDDNNNGLWAEFVRGIRNRGAWAADTIYLKDDIVSNSVNTYVATTDFTSNSSDFDSEPGGLWELFTAGSDELPAQADKADYLLSTDGASTFWTERINISGSASFGQPIYVGPDAYEWQSASAVLTNPAAVFRFDNDSEDSTFAQLAFQNADPTSSTDIITYMDNGDDTYGWMGMGIAGSNFDDTTYGITNPGDGYLFHNAIDDSYTGNMVFATGGEGSENKLIFAAGGFDSGLTQMEITPDTNVHVEIATESISPQTGALTVVGGVGTQGNLNVLGNVNIQGNLEVSGGAFSTEILTSTTPLFTTGEGASDNLKDRGFLVEYKAPSASATFQIGQVSASGGIGRIYRKGFTTLTGGRTDNVATVTVQETSHNILQGETVTISGMTDTTFNGTHVVTAVTQTTFSFANSGDNKAPTADTTGTIAPAIPSAFTVGDSIIVSNCSVALFNGQRDFVRNVSADNIRFDIAASAVQSLVSASGTVVVDTQTKYAGFARNYEDGKFYLVDNLEGTVVNRVGDASLFTGDQRLQPPQDAIEFSASAITVPSIVVGGLEAFGGGGLTLPAITATSASVTGAFNADGGGSFAGTYTGTPTFSGNLTFSGNPTFSGTPIFTGGVRVQEMIEDMVDISHTSNAITCNYQEGNIFYITNTFSANFTVDMTNVPTDDGRIFTVNLVVTQGATGYRPTTLNINSSGTTIKWAGGVIPTPTSSSGKIDVFTFTIYRRSGAYTSLASANLNF